MPRSRFRGLGAALAAVALCASIHAQPAYVFSTFAGAPNFAYADGPASNARFAMPQDVAVDASGNIYIADMGNYVVRKIGTDGTVSTVAGRAGEIGIADGPIATARFAAISGIAVSGGFVYVTDGVTNSVRRIGPEGVTTVAGSGTAGSADGPGRTAGFNMPAGLAVDASGTIYVADYGNSTVRKIAPDGTVSTLAGSPGAIGAKDGVGSAARLAAPFGIAVDSSGNVYVSDWMAATIRKITPDGTVTTVAGAAGLVGSTDGAGAAARFVIPAMLKIDQAGNLYLADRGTYTVRKISFTDGNAVVSTVAGRSGVPGFQDGPAASSRLMRPTGIGIDSTGNVYICDTYNCTIRKLDTAGNVTTIAGQCSGGSRDGTRANASFYHPAGIAMNTGGDLFVTDCWTHTVRKITREGVVTTYAGAAGVQGSSDGPAASARFRYPAGLAFDSKGNLFVADGTNATIRRITPEGMVSTVAGQVLTPGTADGNGTAAQFSAPRGLAFDSSGNLWVADSGNHTIRRITTDGTVTTVAGRAGTRGSADGAAAAATFAWPDGLAFDGAGNLYIADTGNDTIRVMTADGLVSTFVGRAGYPGSTDGTLTTARLSGPAGLSFDGAGNLFVTEDDGDRVRIVTRQGSVSTIAGYFTAGASDGLRPDSRLWGATAVAADALGNVWVADGYNHTIRRGGMLGVAPTSQLRNLSVRANLEANNTLIAGFVVTGAAKPMLLRAVGPGLRPYAGDAQLASNPRLQVYDSAQTVVDSNEDWGGGASLVDAFSKVGAFPLPASSLDAAVVRSISGLHTVHVVSPTSGMAIVEAYDTGSGSDSRLVNLSARYGVTAGNGVLVAGFVIDGWGQKTVLLRGVGPTLTAWGLSGMLTDPVLEIYNSAQEKIAANDDWAPGLASTLERFAFGLQPGSKDAAMLISLPPGSYTVQLTGKDGGTGEGLVEIYEIGN